MQNPFVSHPHSVNETYFQHAKFALMFSLKCFKAGICVFIHAIFPFVFQTAASDQVAKMYEITKDRGK